MVHVFRCLEAIFAIDGDSGALIQLDELGAQAVSIAAEGGGADAIRVDLQGQFDDAEIEAVIADIQALREEGEFFVTLHTDGLTQGDKPLKAMCLHVSHDCDLRCRYCFAGTGSFHARRSLMSYETGKQALDFLVANAGERKLLEVDFFGGEPLLNFEVVNQLVAYGREIERATGKHIAFTLTTNGTNLTPDIADYLNAEMVNLVLSIDGRPAVHDAMRPFPDGTGSHARILPKFLDLVSKRGDKAWYARGTFTRRNLDFSRDVLYLHDAGFEQISVEPAVLPPDSPLSLRQEDLPAILAEYETLAADMLALEKTGKSFTFFHFMIDLENGPCIKKRVSGCGAGCEYVAVTPEGDIYPCHQFVGREGFKLGSVWDGTRDAALTQCFEQANALTKPDCAGCWARLYCTGGCAANAEAFSGSILTPNPIECAMQRKRLECALALHALTKQD